MKRERKKEETKKTKKFYFYFSFERHIFSFWAAGNASASLEKAIPSGLD